MALAAYGALVTCATGASATYSSLNGIKDFSIGDSRDLLDITDFVDGGNIRSRLAGLREVSIDISGDLEPTDTGYLNLRAAYEAGDTCAIQVWYNHGSAATAGVAYLMKVASLETKGAVDGKLEISASLMIDASSGTSVLALG
jgi:predicted secreted protein